MRAPRLARRPLLGLGLAALAAPGMVRAQGAWPERPIRIIVPWPVGGAADLLTRVLAQQLQPRLGQPVVVDNRPGAVTAIGAEQAARAAPDGYTLFVSNADSHAINPFVFRRLPYDPQADFAPVTLFAEVPFALVSGPSQPAIRSLADLIAAARAAPERLSFGSWGAASSGRLAVERIMQAAGIRMLHVPFAGSAPILAAVAGGQIDCGVAAPGGAMQLIQTGQLRGLVVTGGSRIPALPEVPTLREAGLDLTAVSWLALHAPARTPEGVRNRLAAEVGAILRLPAVAEAFRAQACEPVATTPEGLGRFVQEEVARWGEAVRLANLQPE
jgi:tripartite-type tricarboxylate transporter receptor subunit TctC